MSKVIAIGRRGDILALQAAGVETLEVESVGEAEAAVESLKEISDPCVIMITEDLYGACKAEIDSFREGESRAVLAIPSLGAPTGGRLEEVRALVARALGVDLLGREENA